MTKQLFLFGIECEVAFIDENGLFRDFSNSSHENFARIVERLPEYAEDRANLVMGDLGIKRKRWYVEGDERFALDGTFVSNTPKGIEIRTSAHPTIQSVQAELDYDLQLLEAAAAVFGWQVVHVSFNPMQESFMYDPPLNDYEQATHATTPELAASNVYMLSYGPDINISSPNWDDAASIEIGRKLTFYSPYIVPFSFASPFYNHGLWQGYSKRTYERTGKRPAARVFVRDAANHVPASKLTKPARIAAEGGRIEYKAFDAPTEPGLYAALTALVLGIALDTSLPGRLDHADGDMHKQSATMAFDDTIIHDQAGVILQAATVALQPLGYGHYLDVLKQQHGLKRTPAHDLLDKYAKENGDIIKTIRRNHD